MRGHNLIIAVGSIVVIGALLLFVVLQKRVEEEPVPLPRTVPDETKRPIEQKEKPIVKPEEDIESEEQEADTIQVKPDESPASKEEDFAEPTTKPTSEEEVQTTQAEGEETESTSPPLLPPYSLPREYIVDIFSFTDWQPQSVVVYEGDTITFINHDNKLHWPGADPHPTHSALPNFDALGGISMGQSYSHTFRNPGVYGHHDHLLEDPPTIGTITVLPRE